MDRMLVRRWWSMLAVSAEAETLEITTAEGRGADASVRGATPNGEASHHTQNFGDEPVLDFKGSPNLNYHAAVYLRFDLSALKAGG